MKKILVISAAEEFTENREISDSFVANLNQKSDGAYECISIHYNEIGFRLGKEIDAFIIADGRSLREFEFVYIKSYYNYEEQSITLGKILAHLNIKFFCTEMLDALSTTKLTEYAVLATNYLPIPETIYMHSKKLASSFDIIEAAFGVPFILKAIKAKGGEANYLLKSRGEFMQAISENPDREFIAQEFVENDGDLRILIVNNEATLIIGRKRADNNTHLNNTSQGAEAEIIAPSEVGEEVIQTALESAKVMRREVAGVDVMIQPKTNKVYILEVNASPQIGSGAFIEEKLEVFVRTFKKV